MKFRKAGVFMLAALVFAGCASATGGKGAEGIVRSEGFRARKFHATSVEFSAAASPTVTTRKFDSDVEISVRGDIKSYRFINHIKDGDKSREVTVLVAISGFEGAVEVYGANGAVLATYPKGRVFGDALTFNPKTNDGSSMIKWFFGADVIASVIESYGKDGSLVYSEVTVYRPY